MNKVIKISTPAGVSKAHQILEDKASIHQKIKEGKLDEIKSTLRFVKPLSKKIQ